MFDTGTRTVRDDLKELMALVPTDKIIQITVDYLANDPELHEIFAYIPFEEFPKIHAVVEHFTEYKYVSVFMCVLLKHQSNRKNICSVSTGV
jgi:hypothetical protein